jgi:hypothetical protein
MFSSLDSSTSGAEQIRNRRTGTARCMWSKITAKMRILVSSSPSRVARGAVFSIAIRAYLSAQFLSDARKNFVREPRIVHGAGQQDATDHRG